MGGFFLFFFLSTTPYSIPCGMVHDDDDDDDMQTDMRIRVQGRKSLFAILIENYHVHSLIFQMSVEIAFDL